MRFPKRIAEHKCVGAHNYCIILCEPEAGKIERARERKGIEATNYVDGIIVKLYGQPGKWTTELSRFRKLCKTRIAHFLIPLQRWVYDCSIYSVFAMQTLHFADDCAGFYLLRRPDGTTESNSPPKKTKSCHCSPLHGGGFPQGQSVSKLAIERERKDRRLHWSIFFHLLCALYWKPVLATLWFIQEKLKIVGIGHSMLCLQLHILRRYVLHMGDASYAIICNFGNIHRDQESISSWNKSIVWLQHWYMLVFNLGKALPFSKVEKAYWIDGSV